MRLLLADIASGKTDLADILFLVGFILFVIATIIAVMRNSLEMAVISGGLACVALGWLVL